jgi:hypothetical protein
MNKLLIILGKFDISSYLNSLSHLVLAPFLFRAYNLIVVVVLINVFISIITDNYSRLREERMRNSENQNEYTMLDFLKQKFTSVIARFKPKNEKNNKNLYGIRME